MSVLEIDESDWVTRITPKKLSSARFDLGHIPDDASDDLCPCESLDSTDSA